MTGQPRSGPSSPVRRALLGTIAFILLGLLLFVLGIAPFVPELVGDASLDELARRPTVALLFTQGIGLTAAFGLSTWIVGNKALQLDLYQLRWKTSMGWSRGLGAGLVLGILPAATAMFLGITIGGAAWVPEGGSPFEYLSRLGFILLLLAPNALAEEIVFRGVPLVVLSDVLGRPAALVLLSIVFGLMHITNPDVSILALGNIALAGILLSLAFFSPGGMWTAFGAHLAWNGSLVALGAPVSGLPFEIPLIDYRMGGPSWLTGGEFGPEGGLVSTVTITAAIVLTAEWVRKRPT